MCPATQMPSLKEDLLQLVALASGCVEGRPTESVAVASVPVPRHLVGQVIGKRGKNLRAFAAEFPRIHVQFQSGGSARIVCPPTQMPTAMATLLKLVTKAEAAKAQHEARPVPAASPSHGGAVGSSAFPILLAGAWRSRSRRTRSTTRGGGRCSMRSTARVTRSRASGR